MSERKHIDDWLDEPAKDESERLAKEWLEHFRRPELHKDYKWLGDRVLSCEYHGARYRCIGASRLGDVWLTKDSSRENGYDLRIDVAECSAWEMKANDQQRSPHIPPDEGGECGEHQSCGRCGGDGTIHLSEAGPSVWGEDCFCEEDRLIQCPTCRGEGVEK